MLIRLPGVYAPQHDTWLLASALHEARLPTGAEVLELCTGTGALALVAARLGARRVTAVDISSRAALCARINSGLHRLPVRVRRGNLFDAVRGETFDLVVTNPPYVPTLRTTEAGAHAPGGAHRAVRRGRAARAWNAGPDGRELLDRICGEVAEVLAPGGAVLMVHSAVSGVARTVDGLREAGLKAAVVARQRVPFGPVMRARRAALHAAGLLAPSEETEELVVVRGDRPVIPG